MDDIHGLDAAALDRARISRDPRFDGKFFIAVKTTGIYCRPVCPAPSPKKANIRYYATAAAAAEAGFRPCLRCRPEAAPGTPAWLGTSAVVRRALRLIQDGALDQMSVDELAEKIGIGPRHLHRLFTQHVGASPLAVAQTRRLHFAKRLLDETQLSITQIALAAGFGSLRRFNDAFQKTYQRSPRELRRQRAATVQRPTAMRSSLRLAYRPPYDWDHVRDFLATRAIPGVERRRRDVVTREQSRLRVAMPSCAYSKLEGATRSNCAFAERHLRRCSRSLQPRDACSICPPIRRASHWRSRPIRCSRRW